MGVDAILNFVKDLIFKIGDLVISYMKNYGWKTLLGGAQAVILSMISDTLGKVQGLISNAGLEIDLGVKDFDFLGNIGYWDKIVKKIKNTNQALAITGNFGRNMEETLKNALPEALALNASLDDLAAIYTSFIEDTGRIQFLSEKDLVGLVQFKETFGSAMMSAIATGDLVGIGVQRAIGGIQRMTVEANKFGVSSKKVAQTLENNIQRMTSYALKNGVKAFEQMALYANRTNMSMESTLGLVDRMYSGGLEGTIETAANLQLLGGEFAQFGDPLAMMGLMDKPEELQRRLAEMFASKASFDRETGEVGFDRVSMGMMRQAADTLGMDLDEVTRAAIALRKELELKDIMDSNLKGFSDFEATLSKVAGSAYFSKQSNDWVVQIGETVKRVRDLTQTDIASLDTLKSKQSGQVMQDIITENKSLSEAAQAAIDYFKNVRAISREGYDYMYDKFKPMLDDFKGMVNTDNPFTRFLDTIRTYQTESSVKFSNILSDTLTNLPFDSILNVMNAFASTMNTMFDFAVRWGTKLVNTAIAAIDWFNWGVEGLLGIKLPSVPDDIKNFLSEFETSYENAVSERDKVTATQQATQSTQANQNTVGVAQNFKNLMSTISNPAQSPTTLTTSSATAASSTDPTLSTQAFKFTIDIQLNSDSALFKDPKVIKGLEDGLSTLIQKEIRNSYSGTRFTGVPAKPF